MAAYRLIVVVAVAEGLEVTLDPKRLHLPTTCAACDGPADTRVLLPGALGKVASLSIPICAECRMRGRAERRTWLMLVIPVTLAGVAAVAIGLVVHADVGPALALGSGVAATVAGVSLWGLQRLESRRRRAWPPVCMVAARTSRLVLYCANPAWGTELAARSGGTIAPARPGVERRLAAVVIGGGACVGLVSALIGWESANTRVYVDNAFSTPLVIWVDGERALVVDGSAKDWFSVRPGSRVLGYSSVTEESPRATIRVVISDARYLYNPGRRACHWRIETVYARTPGVGATITPVERRELQPLTDVTDWFQPSPTRVELDSWRRSKTRTAIVRNDACTRLVARGCPEARIQGMTACQVRAESHAAARECESAAFTDCPGRLPGGAR